MNCLSKFKSKGFSFPCLDSSYLPLRMLVSTRVHSVPLPDRRLYIRVSKDYKLMRSKKKKRRTGEEDKGRKEEHDRKRKERDRDKRRRGKKEIRTR